MSSFSVVEFVLAPLIALVGTLINGFIAKALARIWLPEDKARIASFSFMLGSLAGLRSSNFPITAGALVGLAVLWLALFRRSKRKTGELSA